MTKYINYSMSTYTRKRTRQPANADESICVHFGVARTRNLHITSRYLTSTNLCNEIYRVMQQKKVQKAVLRSYTYIRTK